MKKIVSLILVFCLAIPFLASAAPARFKASDTLTTDEKQVFDATSYPKLGAEYVYLNKDLTEASFTRSKICNTRYSLHYICLCQKIFKRRPGTCPCGKALVPAVKIQNAWYHLNRNAMGQVEIKAATTEDCCVPADAKSDCASCSSCSK